MAMINPALFYRADPCIGGVLKVLNTDSSMTWIWCGSYLILTDLCAVPGGNAKIHYLTDLIDRLNLVSREILTEFLLSVHSAEKHEEDRLRKRT